MPTPASVPSHSVRRLDSVSDSQMQALAQLLIDCVENGASVSFMHPLPMDKALAFWRGCHCPAVCSAAR